MAPPHSPVCLLSQHTATRFRVEGLHKAGAGLAPGVQEKSRPRQSAWVPVSRQKKFCAAAFPHKKHITEIVCIAHNIPNLRGISPLPRLDLERRSRSAGPEIVTFNFEIQFFARTFHYRRYLRQKKCHRHFVLVSMTHRVFAPAGWLTPRRHATGSCTSRTVPRADGSLFGALDSLPDCAGAAGNFGSILRAAEVAAGVASGRLVGNRRRRIRCWRVRYQPSCSKSGHKAIVHCFK